MFSEKYKVPQKKNIYIYMQNAQAYEETVIRLIGLGMEYGIHKKKSYNLKHANYTIKKNTQ